MSVDAAAAGSDGVEELLRQVLQRLEQLEIRQAVETAAPPSSSGIVTPQRMTNVPRRDTRDTMTGSTRERVPFSKHPGLSDVSEYEGQQENTSRANES